MTTTLARDGVYNYIDDCGTQHIRWGGVQETHYAEEYAGIPAGLDIICGHPIDNGGDEPDYCGAVVRLQPGSVVREAHICCNDANNHKGAAWIDRVVV